MRMQKKTPHPTTTKTNYWPVLQVWTWSWALQRPPGRRCRRQRPPPWGTCSPPGPLCTHRDDQYSLKTAVGVGPWGSSHHCAQSPPGSSEIVLFRPTCFTLARECPQNPNDTLHLKLQLLQSPNVRKLRLLFLLLLENNHLYTNAGTTVNNCETLNMSSINAGITVNNCGTLNLSEAIQKLWLGCGTASTA